MIIVTLVGLLFLLFSCGASKKITKTDTVETKTIFKTDTIYKLKTDSVIVTKTETKTETNTEFVFDTIYKENPPKIIYRSDGSIEVTGLKTAKLQLSYWQNKYDSLAKEYELERGNSLYYQNEAKQVKTVEVVKKKPLWWLFFLGLFIGLLGGVYLGVKFHHKLK